MPKVDNVGFGDFTGFKIEIIEMIFDIHMAVNQEVLRGNSFHKQDCCYIDATAEKGFVPESTILGRRLEIRYRL
jgi:hypothetical protein